jgi:outer membrane lipoprotein SlyB
MILQVPSNLFTISSFFTNDNIYALMKTLKILFVALSLAVAFCLVSCAQNNSPDVYDSAETGVVSRVMPGTIIAKRPIKIDGNSGAGGLAGVAAGAAAGSGMGGSLAANVVGAVGGAVAGGVIGNSMDKKINGHDGFEYIIKLKNGSIISVAQSKELEFSLKQHVLIVYGARTRIIADTTKS